MRVGGEASISAGPILVGSRVLVCVVPPDEAARGGAENAMVTGIVTRHTADDGSLEAALGRSGSGNRRKREKNGGENSRESHRSYLLR